MEKLETHQWYKERGSDARDVQMWNAAMGSFYRSLKGMKDDFGCCIGVCCNLAIQNTHNIYIYIYISGAQLTLDLSCFDRTDRTISTVLGASQ